MRVVNILILLLLISSCKRNVKNNESKDENILSKKIRVEQNIISTKWMQKISESGCNYIQFINQDSVVLYLCEPDEKILGKYSFSNDTVLINTLKGEYDDDFPEDSRHRHKRVSFKMVVEGDTLSSVKNPNSRYFKAKKE